MEQKPKQKTVKGISPEAWRELRVLALQEGITVAQMIEELIAYYIGDAPTIKKTKEE